MTDPPDESITEIQRMALIERLRIEKKYHKACFIEGLKRALLGERPMPGPSTDHIAELKKIEEALLKLGVADMDAADGV